MWTRENRGLCERKGVRYPSDLRDAEWALIAPLIPPAKHGGRKRSVDVREVLNGVLYVLETGCQWRASPEPGCRAPHRSGRSPATDTSNGRQSRHSSRLKAIAGVPADTLVANLSRSAGQTSLPFAEWSRTTLRHPVQP